MSQRTILLPSTSRPRRACIQPVVQLSLDDVQSMDKDVLEFNADWLSDTAAT